MGNRGITLEDICKDTGILSLEEPLVLERPLLRK